MLISDIQILDRLTRADESRIVVEPIINLQRQLGPSSLDVHLGYEFRIFRSPKYTHLNPLSPKTELKREVKNYTELLVIAPNPVLGRFILHPGEFALASTLELISLPKDIAARLEGRSSWGRLGLQVHSTAGFIDPGFQGTATYELVNVGSMPIPRFVGLRIGQLAFFQLGEHALNPYGERRKYHRQLGPTPSRFYDDPEFDVLRSYMDEIRERDYVEYLTSLGHKVIPPDSKTST